MSDTHRARHMRLHDALDELVADYLRYHRDQQIDHLSVRTLLDWSAAQAQRPQELQPGEPDGGHHNGAQFTPSHPEGDDDPDAGGDDHGT
jgi:hypothetical protein